MPSPSDMPTPQPRPVNMPAEIGGYQIQRVLGSGGMATVYAALQKQPRRTVALKVMKAGIDAKSALHRFKREVEILGRLRHPFIAQVYDAGVYDDGTGVMPYFVMEYVPGAKTILEYAAAKDLNTRERLKMFVKVCAAIEHGHQHKVIHRDLKPDNILIDERGEVKVIDYGVARAMEANLTGQTLHTEAGRLVGTVQYMSPEQVEATPQDIDSRCDVYSLGAVLYKLLTGQLPHDFEGMPLFEAMRVIREDAPVKPSVYKPELRGDLETIILKALAKDRRHRYRNAGSLGRDLVRYLAHKPINARRASLAHRLHLFSRRNRTSLIAASVIVAVMAIAGVIVLAIAHQSRQSVRKSEQQFTEQLEERDAALEQARAALQEQEAAAAELPAGPEAFTLTGHTAPVRCVAFDPTGALLASTAGGDDHSIVLWDLKSREVLRALDEHDAPVSHLMFNADGNTLLSSDDDETIVVLEASTGAFRGRIRHDYGLLSCLAISPDGERMAMGAADLTLRVRPVEGEDEMTIRGTRGGFLSVAFSPDGTQLIAGTERDVVYVWDAETGGVLRTLDGLRGRIVGVGLDPNNTRALAVAEDGTGMVWDLLQGKEEEYEIVACPEPIRFVGIDPTGRVMICASAHWTGFWDVDAGSKLRDALRPGPLLQAAAISSDGAWYALGGIAGDIYMRPMNAGP